MTVSYALFSTPFINNFLCFTNIISEMSHTQRNVCHEALADGRFYVLPHQQPRAHWQSWGKCRTSVSRKPTPAAAEAELKSPNERISRKHNFLSLSQISWSVHHLFFSLKCISSNNRLVCLFITFQWQTRPAWMAFFFLRVLNNLKSNEYLWLFPLTLKASFLN